MLLVLDVHKAQKTDGILHRLDQCNTTPVYVPAGTTGLVQPVDVVFNAPFKAAVDRLATTHVQENLQDYVRGSIPAGEQRVLFTKWIGQAWEEVSAKKEMVIRSFQKCGISVPIDGSSDDDINICSLPNYKVGEEEKRMREESDPFESDSDSDEY